MLKKSFCALLSLLLMAVMLVTPVLSAQAAANPVVQAEQADGDDATQSDDDGEAPADDGDSDGDETAEEPEDDSEGEADPEINRAMLEKEFRLVSQNANLELWYRRTDHNIAVVQRWNDKIWTSFPYYYAKDKVAKGELRENLRSHLIMTMLDRNGSSEILRSATHSLKENPLEDMARPNATVELLYPEGYDSHDEDPALCQGIRFSYYFPKNLIEVPIEFHLRDDRLQMVLPVGDITGSHATKVLTEVRPNPYFGVGSMDQDGYVFLPDGSGAIMNYNNGKTNYNEYTSTIYGFDSIFTMQRIQHGLQTTRMPVFGQQQIDRDTGAGNAYLAIITKGAGQGTIIATPAGKVTAGNSYNCAGVSFKVRMQDKYDLTGNDQRVVSMVTALPGYLSQDTVSIDYFFLKKEGTEPPTWIDMALCYRQYLIDEQGMKPLSQDVDTRSMIVETLGAVGKNVPVVGIQMRRNLPLTTFDQMGQISEELKADGVTSQILRPLSWTSNAQRYKITNKIDPASSLGGKRDYRALRDKMASLDFGFYPDFELVNVAKNGNGFKSGRDAARAISGRPAVQTIFSLATLMKPTAKGSPTWYLASPLVVEKNLQTLTKSLKKNDTTSASLGSLTNTLYSDARTKDKISQNRQGQGFISRDEADPRIAAALQQMANEGINIMASAGNGYSFASATVMVDTPMDSSNFYIFDYSVPFYQVVLNGYALTSATSLNLASSPYKALLKAIEYNTALKYTFIWASGSVLKETELQAYASVEFAKWRGDATQAYQQWLSVRTRLEGAEMAAFDYLDTDVRKVTYTNGVCVYINYANSEYTTADSGVVIPARGFVVIGGGADLRGSEQEA